MNMTGTEMRKEARAIRRDEGCEAAKAFSQAWLIASRSTSSADVGDVAEAEEALRLIAKASKALKKFGWKAEAARR